MRVAQVCARYSPYIGGVETHVRMISEWMQSNNVEVDILTTDPRGKLPPISLINGIRVHRFHSYAPGEAYYFSPSLHKFLKKHSGDYDIVHAHSYHSFPALYAARTKRNNLIFTPHYHGTGHSRLRSLLHVPYRFFGKKIFEKADLVISVSRYEKNLLTKDFKGLERKIVIIPNGLALQEFPTHPKIHTSKRQILYVGRLEKYKRIDCIIRSFQYLPSDIQLEIVGTGPDKQRLQSMLAQLQLEDRVIFSENLDRNDLLQRYSTARVFVSLSEHEAYGITVAEALASGTPCVVAKTSALSEYVDNNNCLGIDHPEEPRDLANLISKAMDIEVVKFKSQSWEQVAEEVLGVYKNATAQ